MADSELLELPAVTDLTDSDQFYLVQGGNSRRASMALLKSKMGGAGGSIWAAVVETPADLAIYDGQNAGYTVLVQNAADGRSAIYVKNSVGWNPPVFVTGTVGPASKKVEMRTTETHIQWRIEDGEWGNLVALSDLKGDSVELRLNAGGIQWRVTGDPDWIDLVDLADISGPPSDLQIGTVTESDTETFAVITGTYPNQKLNLTLRRGATGTVTPQLLELLEDTETARDQAVAAKNDSVTAKTAAEQAVADTNTTKGQIATIVSDGTAAMNLVADRADGAAALAQRWAESETYITPGHYSAKYWADRASETASKGTVTSVDVNLPVGFSKTGGAITTSGVISFAYASGYQGFLTTQSTKLAAIADAATKNQTDAYLLNRANHTGAIATSVVTGLDAALVAKLNTSAKGTAGGLAELDGAGKVPTSQLPDSILGNMRFQDFWNAATNSPAIPAAAAANKGWYYIIQTAGATNVNGQTDWEVGDWIVSNGARWDKIDNTDAVSSVAGLRGVITALALQTALGLGSAAYSTASTFATQIALDALSLATTNALAGKLGKTEKAADSALLEGKTAAEQPVSTLQAAADNLRVKIAGDNGLGFFESVLKPSVATGATLKPPRTISNFQMYGNTGNFVLEAPDSTADISYSMQLYIWPAAGAGAMTTTGFSAPPKGTFNPSASNILTIRVIGTAKFLSIEAMT